MELWIRSQNKRELIKSNRIYQFGGTIYGEAKEDIELGTYKSRERALEVLDEIQVFLTKTDIDGNRWYEFSIFEMPKE